MFGGGLPGEVGPPLRDAKRAVGGLDRLAGTGNEHGYSLTARCGDHALVGQEGLRDLTTRRLSIANFLRALRALYGSAFICGPAGRCSIRYRVSVL